jgi:hypothetical protein
MTRSGTKSAALKFHLQQIISRICKSKVNFVGIFPFEKLTVTQLFQKFPTFYKTLKFIRTLD